MFSVEIASPSSGCGGLNWPFTYPDIAIGSSSDPTSYGGLSYDGGLLYFSHVLADSIQVGSITDANENEIEFDTVQPFRDVKYSNACFDGFFLWFITSLVATDESPILIKTNPPAFSNSGQDNKLVDGFVSGHYCNSHLNEIPRTSFERIRPVFDGSSIWVFYYDPSIICELRRVPNSVVR